MDPIDISDNFIDRCHILGTARLNDKDLIYYYYNHKAGRNIVCQVATGIWYETTTSFQNTTVHFLHEAGCENNYFINNPEAFAEIIPTAENKSTDEILETVQWSDLYSLREAVVFKIISI
jgi:hypothetical protein